MKPKFKLGDKVIISYFVGNQKLQGKVVEILDDKEVRVLCNELIPNTSTYCIEDLSTKTK